MSGANGCSTEGCILPPHPPGGPHRFADRLDAAIAAEAAKPVEVAMQQINVTISSTGRPAIIVIPNDVSDSELAELAGWVLTAVLNAKRAEREKGAASRILVPAGRVT